MFYYLLLDLYHLVDMFQYRLYMEHLAHYIDRRKSFRITSMANFANKRCISIIIPSIFKSKLAINLELQVILVP